MGNINGIALASIGIGGVFLYGGLTNRSPLQAVLAIVQGSSPSSVTQGASVVSSPSVGASATDSQISNTGGTYGPILTAMQSWGFSMAGEAGAIGNLQEESGFSPTAGNPQEGAIGIAQWEGGRRTALQAYAASHGGSETDLAMQLGYMHFELMTSYPDVFGYMKLASDPAAAATYWDANYERSAGTTRSQRIANAQAIYATLQGNAGPSKFPTPAPGKVKAQ